jgi:hypothetical protein
METQKSKEITTLAELISYALMGMNVVLNTKPMREIVKFEHDGKEMETIIVSMEYSGTVGAKPFKFKKEYSHTYDEAEYALDCVLIANNRLQVDYDRLRHGGIEVKGEFFTFQNTFFGLPGIASERRPALRVEAFINLARSGIPVSVDVVLKRPDVLVKEEEGEKKGFAYVADFVFTTDEGKTTIEKLYDQALYDDTEEQRARVKEVANKRLERDFERLRRVGIEVKAATF